MYKIFSCLFLVDMLIKDFFKEGDRLYSVQNKKHLRRPVSVHGRSFTNIGSVGKIDK